MDKLASTLLAFPPEANLSKAAKSDNVRYDVEVRHHVGKLSKIIKDHKADLIAFGPQFLELLNPAVNSLSYLAVLHTLILPSIAASVPHDIILEKLVLFLMKYDAQQCRYARNHLLEVLFVVGNGRCLPPSVAVEVLATAILRLDPTGSMLTSSHILLAKLAYNTNNIDPALQVIDKQIVFFPGMANYTEPSLLCDLTLSPPAYIMRETGLTGPLKSSSVMEYDLLCSMMYCSKRDWAKAYAALERVVAYPTREGACSKIMVEAYNKWVLVSLLLHGKLGESKAHTGSTAYKLYGNFGKPYVAVAVLFTTDDADALKAEVEKNAQQWDEDGNTGLMKEVLASYQKWRIIGLEQIYSKVSLTEIRQQTKSAETGQILEREEEIEILIQDMIISGMLNGVIEKDVNGTTSLTFLPTTTQLSEQEFAKELAAIAAQIKRLHPIFNTTKERLGASNEYIKHMIKEEKRNDKNDADPTLAFDTQVDDEDLMGGVVATG